MEEKYESDLTRKEKFQIEKEKLKRMNFRQKVEYIITYYKFVFVIIIVAAILVGIGVQIYNNKRQVELISVAVMDVSADDERCSVMSSDLLDYLGSGDKWETVTLNSTLRSSDQYTDIMARSTIIGAGGIDILICGSELYEEYDGQEAFKDWKELLGSDYDTYAEYFEDGRLDVTRCEKWNEYALVGYSPVYAGALVYSGKSEEAVKFLQFLTGK